MKLHKILTLASLLMACVVVTPNRAWAGRVDCALGSCGFGGPVASSAPSAITGSGWSATVSTAVYLTGSTYTYAYTFDLIPFGTGGVTMSSLTTATTFALDNFVSSLNFGLVTDETNGVSTPGAISFTFNPSSLAVAITGSGLVSPSSSGSNQILTFYAQSGLAPGAGNFSAADGGSGTTASVLNPVPEPASVLLLFSGAGLLSIGGVLRRLLIRSV